MQYSKKTLKTLKECTKKNPLVEALYTFSDGLKITVKRLAILETVLFLLISVFKYFFPLIEALSEDRDPPFDIDEFFHFAFVWLFVSVLIEISLYAMHLVFAALAQITESTRISANVALYNASKSNPDSDEVFLYDDIFTSKTSYNTEKNLTENKEYTICPNCYCESRIKTDSCQFCGYVFESNDTQTK